ncbi:MAG: hypothetical protein ACLP07_12695 [Terracidiphilus sp.]
MAIIVVGGGGRGAGKTALVCGLMRALPEIPWTAVKITTHEHGKAAPIWEETTPGNTTDTARYLAAGARRALLVAATESALGSIVQQLLDEHPRPAGVIFESNSVLGHVRPEVCLCASSSPWTELKASSDLLLEHADAMVELAGHDHIVEAEKITFRLAAMERVSPVMLVWVRERLGARP